MGNHKRAAMIIGGGIMLMPALLAGAIVSTIGIVALYGLKGAYTAAQRYENYRLSKHKQLQK